MGEIMNGDEMKDEMCLENILENAKKNAEKGEVLKVWSDLNTVLEHGLEKKIYTKEHEQKSDDILLKAYENGALKFLEEAKFLAEDSRFYHEDFGYFAGFFEVFNGKLKTAKRYATEANIDISKEVEKINYTFNKKNLEHQLKEPKKFAEHGMVWECKRYIKSLKEYAEQEGIDLSQREEEFKQTIKMAYDIGIKENIRLAALGNYSGRDSIDMVEKARKYINESNKTIDEVKELLGNQALIFGPEYK